MIDPNFSVRQQEIIYQDIQRRNTRPSTTSQSNLITPPPALDLEAAMHNAELNRAAGVMNNREVSAFQVAADDDEIGMNQAEIGTLVRVNQAAANRNGEGNSRGENQDN